ncbi:MAG: cation:proton antiporter [Alphaproteobacteria bacterium]|nr:cation:proton antiporter [Alphaproteobacteria bacterium]MBU0793206.1 cation:proton antiporter [Alphaproteobacteria bacterium]MBU0877537.1 cation:proton antiporter [Alphaproteobacteria bacterium]MBU1768130.1 cation:proton antiporter [Alphaproteobacteria bacterium]
MIHGPYGSQAFNEALVILGAAGLVIPAFARFRISPIIGFILVGLLVGPFGLGRFVAQYPALNHVTISRESAITSFAELGIVMLLFSIGLELSFKRLWSMRRFVFGTGAAELLGSAALIGTGLYLLGNSLYASIGLGLALSLSSTALVMPIAGTHSAVGKSAFGMLLFEDLAIVPIVFALGAMAPNVADEGWTDLASVLLTGGAAVVALLIGGRLLLPRLFAQAARAKRPEVFLAASLLVVMVSSLITTAAGLSPIVGALVAGLLIAETDYHGQVEGMTEPFKGLALGVFLITVGMAIDPVALLAQWDTLLLAITGVVLTKVAVTSLLLRLAGARRGVALETAILMGSPSETTLIVLATAMTANLISPDTAAFWQMATAIGLTLTPIFAKFGHNMALRVELNTMDSDIDDAGAASRDAIILGFGRVGRTVADLLRVHNISYIAVENDIDIVAKGRADGYVVHFGDVSRPETLDRLRLGHAQALIITMDDPVLAMRITQRVRGWLDELPIIVRARDTDHAAQLYRAGASDAVPETLESSLHLAETALVDLGLPMGPVIASVHQKREDLQNEIKAAAEMDVAPRLRSRRLDEAGKSA